MHQLSALIAVVKEKGMERVRVL